MSTSGNADALVMVMVLMPILSVGPNLVPFLPGGRSIPRWIPLHRLVWRSYYRAPRTPQPGGAVESASPLPAGALGASLVSRATGIQSPAPRPKESPCARCLPYLRVTGCPR